MDVFFFILTSIIQQPCYISVLPQAYVVNFRATGSLDQPNNNRKNIQAVIFIGPLF